MARQQLDVLAREHRMKKAARERMVRDAFAATGIVLLHLRNEDIIAVIHASTMAGWPYRVTYFDGRGPIGHSFAKSHASLHEHVADYYPLEVESLTQMQADEWLRERAKP